MTGLQTFSRPDDVHIYLVISCLDINHSLVVYVYSIQSLHEQRKFMSSVTV